MSNAKSKRLATFAAKAKEEKWDDINLPPKNRDIRRKADELMAKLHFACKCAESAVESGLNEQTTESLIQLFDAQKELFLRFIECRKRRDGNLFRALADSIERKRNTEECTDLELYVYNACGMDEYGCEIPSAAAILKGYKIYKGVPPQNEKELAYIWPRFYPNTPFPKGFSEQLRQIEAALQEKLGRQLSEAETESIASMQTIQVERAAKNVGYCLPKNKKKHSAMPAGDFAHLREDFVF